MYFALSTLLMICLRLIHLLGKEAKKVEYVRTLSIALLSWTPWMSRVPACCFGEESCEAMLSRMSTRCHQHKHVSDLEGVIDLYLTLTPPSRKLKNTRGTLRQGLLSVLFARTKKLISMPLEHPFADWTTKKTKFQSALPDDWEFPMPLAALNPVEVDEVLWHSLRCLVKKSELQPGLEDFLNGNLQPCDANARFDFEQALKQIPGRQTTVRRRPIVRDSSSV